MKRTKEVEEAISDLDDYDSYSAYEEIWAIVKNYILELEEKVENYENREHKG